MVEVEIFDSLNNEIRLEILNFVSTKCRTKAQIVRHLEEKLSQKITLPNLDQNHIPKLLKIGVVRKEAGFDDDGRPVTYFCPVPNKIEPLIDVVNALGNISNPQETSDNSLTIIDNAPVRIDLNAPKTSKPKVKILMSREEIDRKGLARPVQYPLSKEDGLCIGRKHDVIDGEQDCVKKKDNPTCAWPHLTLDDRTVSRHHARILYEEGKYFLEDIYSKQGTMLIHMDGSAGVYLPGRLWERWGARVNAKAELRHLDVFKIGSFWFEFIE